MQSWYRLILGTDSKGIIFIVFFKVNHLEAEMAKLTADQFVSCRPNLNRLFEECLVNLECRERPIRVVYALQTLCGLVKAVFRKQVKFQIET